jgi:hypothetical protein
VNGLKAFAESLVKIGVSRDDMDTMIESNPH